VIQTTDPFVPPNRDAPVTVRPSFLITIDVEGDNLWARPSTITTQNAIWLPRFQTLCESYGLRPTYLTNFEMAIDPAYQEFAQDVLQRNTAEIGMHLHAWNSPPLYELAGVNPIKHQTYLVDYPLAVMREKIVFLTNLLEDTFQKKMVSHRAGRWYLNEPYAQLLVENGYQVDCSVTPHVSWRRYRAFPQGLPGADYRSFPEKSYRLDLQNIRAAGRSGLREVPVTIMVERNGLRNCLPAAWQEMTPLRAVLNRISPIRWLRPNGQNRDSLLAVLRWVVAEGRDYAQFVLHSSELMPGGSPLFPTEASIERLYDDIESLFSAAAGYFQGRTLREYDGLCVQANRDPS
jgi:hypothetical protein